MLGSSCLVDEGKGEGEGEGEGEGRRGMCEYGRATARVRAARVRAARVRVRLGAAY